LKNDHLKEIPVVLKIKTLKSIDLSGMILLYFLVISNLKLLEEE
jgi:hypothetical protein